MRSATWPAVPCGTTIASAGETSRLGLCDFRRATERTARARKPEGRNPQTANGPVIDRAAGGLRGGDFTDVDDYPLEGRGLHRGLKPSFRPVCPPRRDSTFGVVWPGDRSYQRGGFVIGPFASRSIVGNWERRRAASRMSRVNIATWRSRTLGCRPGREHGYATPTGNPYSVRTA